MYLNFDDNRPDTPRVPTPFTRLERLLIVVVTYQFLLLAYLFAPESWTQPVRQAFSPDEPIRYVEVQPIIDRSAIPKKLAPPSDLDRRAASPEPVPQNDEPRSKGDTPDKIEGGPTDPPQAVDTPRTVSNMGRNDAPPVPTGALSGLLDKALKDLGRFTQNSNNDNPNAGVNQSGPDIQFDSKGVDFGSWLRRFRAQVIGNWMIPQAAMVMHGHVVIQMVIHRGGAITDIRIVQPSGIGAFDSAAMTALKLSNPTLQLPSAYPGESIDPFTVIFYYNERVPAR